MLHHCSQCYSNNILEIMSIGNNESSVIDVHAHLYPSLFPNKQIDQILARAQNANVASVVAVSQTLEDAKSIFALKNDSSIPLDLREMIEPCAGLHPVTPQGAKSVVKLDQVNGMLEFIKEKSSELVGIGEGLYCSSCILPRGYLHKESTLDL